MNSVSKGKVGMYRLTRDRVLSCDTHHQLPVAAVWNPQIIHHQLCHG